MEETKDPAGTQEPAIEREDILFLPDD